MDGYLKISNLRIPLLIGVYEHEREQKQELLVDFRFRVDVARCSQSDALEDAIDYTKVAALLEEVAQSREFNLIETFGYHALEAVCVEFRLSWAAICIKKRALSSADFVSFELERGV